MTKSCRHGGLRYQVGELGDLNDAFSGFPYSPVLTWDTERAEAEALRGELSEAFEARHRELQTAQAQIARHIEQQSHQQAQIWPDQRPELRRVKCVDALCVNAQITSHEWK